MDGAERHRSKDVAQSDGAALLVIRDGTDSKAMEQACVIATSGSCLHDFSHILAWITGSEGTIQYLKSRTRRHWTPTLDACRGKSPFEPLARRSDTEMLDNTRQVARTANRSRRLKYATLRNGKPHHS